MQFVLPLEYVTTKTIVYVLTADTAVNLEINLLNCEKPTYKAIKCCFFSTT